MPENVAMPKWVSKYVGDEKANSIKSKVENPEDENYFSDLGVDASDGLDDDEWLTIASDESNSEGMDDVKFDSTKEELYLELESWDEDIINACYDVSALAKEYNISEDEVKAQIHDLFREKNNILDLSRIENQKVYLPTIPELSEVQKTQSNSNTSSTTTSSNTSNVDIKKGVEDIFTSFKSNSDLDITNEMNKLGILDIEAEPNSYEAGLQSMYYAFGGDWNLVESMMRYCKAMNKDLEIPFAEKLNLALERCNKGEDGLNKDDIKKACLIYYGSASDVPTSLKNDLGITTEEEIESDLDGLDPSNPEETKNTLDDIISKIEHGDPTQPGTIEAELLALKEIYGDDWKDIALPVIEKSTDSDGKVNLEVGSLTDELFNKWLDGTETFDDQKMLNACKKLYGHESLWPQADNLDKKNVKVLIETCKAMNEFNLGKIDETELKSKFNSLSTQIDELSEQTTGSFLAGLKALRVAWGDDWVDNFIGKAKYNNGNLSDIDFTSAIENFAQHETNQDKIKEVCNIYFGEGNYPDSINTILGIGSSGSDSSSNSGPYSDEELNVIITELNNAFAPEGLFDCTDEDKLSEIIMGSTKEQLSQICIAWGGYESLIEKIQSETSCEYEKILVATIENAVGISPDKYTGATVAKMAEDLKNATINYGWFGGWGTDEGAVRDILINAPDDQLIKLAKYMNENKDEFGGNTLEDMINSDFSGDDYNAYIKKLKRLGITNEQLSNGNSTSTNGTATTEESKDNKNSSQAQETSTVTTVQSSAPSTGAFEPSSYITGTNTQQTNDPYMLGQRKMYN